jgi:hypothetical protein
LTSLGPALAVDETHYAVEDSSGRCREMHAVASRASKSTQESRPSARCSHHPHGCTARIHLVLTTSSMVIMRHHARLGGEAEGGAALDGAGRRSDWAVYPWHLRSECVTRLETRLEVSVYGGPSPSHGAVFLCAFTGTTYVACMLYAGIRCT